MNKLEEAARQALEALEEAREMIGYPANMVLYGEELALREALAEQVHTPYCKQAPMCKTPCGNPDCVEQAEQEPIGMILGGELVALVEEYQTGAWPIYAAPVQQAEQEPVAVVEITYGRDPECYVTGNIDDFPEGVFKLYAAPARTKDPCHPWQDLTDDEIDQVRDKTWCLNNSLREFAGAVIAKFKEKNNANNNS